MKRILILEDDQALGVSWKLALEEAGFDAHHVGDAQRAVEVVNSGPFDLVISDMLIHGPDATLSSSGGLTLLGHISLHVHPKPQVLAVSGANPSLNLLNHATVLKADRTLPKPFPVEKLVEVAVEMLHKGSADRESVAEPQS